MDARQIRQLKPKLAEFLARFDDCFPRCDTREHLPVYVEGQLSDLQRKSVEPIALKAGVAPRTLQQFLSKHRWDEGCMRDKVQQIVATEHSNPRAIAIIDETSDAKKGDKTPGVQRQHCGAEGKKDNCIVTVHLGWAVDDFHCLLDGELFLPESWANDRERCREAGIPDTMVYRPKTEIALELYDRARANGLTFAYLTFDEWYGAKPDFLRALDRRRQKYVGEIPKNVRGWLRPPRLRRGPRGGLKRAHEPSTVTDLLRYSPALCDQKWKRFRVKDGEKGPMVWEVKHVRFYPQTEDGDPARPAHLMVARNVLNPDEVKFFLSNAPPETPVDRLLLVAFSRWRIERCFEDQKGEVGLDHYEGRHYRGLKRHLILTMVSYLFLSRVRQDLREKKSGADGVPSAHGGGRSGPRLVAIRPSLFPPVRTSGRRNSLCPNPPGPSPQEPHQENATETPSSRHPPNRLAALPVAYNLAL
jgi:SRSO17 transposase